MRAIITKYHGPTNTRGSYIKATAEGCKPVKVSFHSVDDPHKAAALALANSMNWLGDGWGLVEGGLDKGDAKVWVFFHPKRTEVVK